MKAKLKRLLRVIAPLPVCLMILLISALPAFAFSQSFQAGTYVFDDQMDQPDTSFLVNVQFTSAGTAYKGIIYRSPDLEASFKYGALYFIRESDGEEYRACYWINAETYWLGYDERVIIFPNDFTIDNSSFYAWFVINAKQAIVDNPDPWGDLSQDQIDSVVDILQQNKNDIGSIEDAYGKLPLPNVNPDDYSISLWLETEYQAFVSCLAVFWQNSLIMNVVAILGALLLVSFLVFGSK